MLKRITLALTLFVSAGCQSNVKEFQLTPSLTGSPIGPVAAVALKVEFRQTPPREQRKIIRAIYEDMHVQYEKFAQGKLDEIELRRRLRVRLRLLAAIAAQIGEDPESVIKARGLNYTPGEALIDYGEGAFYSWEMTQELWLLIKRRWPFSISK